MVYLLIGIKKTNVIKIQVASYMYSKYKRKGYLKANRACI